LYDKRGGLGGALSRTFLAIGDRRLLVCLAFCSRRSAFGGWIYGQRQQVMEENRVSNKLGALDMIDDFGMLSLNFKMVRYGAFLSSCSQRTLRKMEPSLK
jgi:hypothetical protein